MQPALNLSTTAPSQHPSLTDESATWANALDALGQAVGIFDHARRLETWNRLFIDAFGYPSDLCQHGVALADLMAFEAKNAGIMSPDLKACLQRERDAIDCHESFVAIRNSPDGRCMRVTTQFLADSRLVRAASEIAEPVSPSPAVAPRPLAPRDANFEVIEALEAMEDAFVFFDANDRLVGCNQKYKDFYGAVSGEISAGASFEDLLRAAVARDQIDLDGRSAEEYVSWRMSMRDDPTAQFDLCLQDGRWLRVSERRMSSGGVVSVQTDVTELKTREQTLRAISDELARQNVLFDAALNNMVQGLCMFDENQRLIVVNRRYLEIYKFSAQVVKPGVTLREIMEYSVALGNYTQDDGERALAERPSQAAKREQDVSLQKLRDGRVIAVMHSPLPNGGSVATYEDVTQRERSEATLRDYASRLENSNKELQAFAFVASHDLQEPLRKIESFGDRLLAKCGDSIGDEGQMYIERMHNAAQRMRRLISDLLHYSRITTQAQPFQPVELDRAIEGVISDLQIALEESGGVIDVEPMPIIEADPTQIRQLFQNLISNSLKFRKHDVKPKISISGRIFATTNNEDASVEQCEIIIRDNGIGFDNKYADRIFAIFQRLHGKSEYEGTGIGLATVRKIVDRHGGTIEANGVLDEGATFVITLPAQHASREKS